MKFCKKFYSWRKVTAFISLLLFSLSMFFPLAVCAEDVERTITIKAFYHQYYGGSEALGYSNVYKVTGMGRFVVRSYRYRKKGDGSHNGGYGMAFRLFSDKDFICQHSTAGGRAGTFSDKQVECYNGIYYITFGVTGGLLEKLDGHDVVETWSGFANLTVVADWDSIPTAEEIIDSGALDLTRDSYLNYDELEKEAVYNNSLDLVSFGAHAYQKWSVKRNPDNSGWDFISDEEAGTRYEWTYKTDIEDSYIKFTYYGNCFEKMFDPVYNDGVLSLSGDGVQNVVSMSCARSLKEKMIYTKADLFNALYAKYGYSKIYAFETKYVYAQCFGYVDGEFCRSRTYRVNYDMVREDGDTWILEPTGSDPLPEEYVPDDSDPTPRPSDPDPDPGDWEDTTPNPLPPNPADPDFPTDNSILNALRWLYETLSGLKDSLGAFPSLVNSIFGFLPQHVILLLGASIVLVVVMRFAGR